MSVANAVTEENAERIALSRVSAVQICGVASSVHTPAVVEMTAGNQRDEETESGTLATRGTRRRASAALGFVQRQQRNGRLTTRNKRAALFDIAHRGSRQTDAPADLGELQSTGAEIRNA